MDLVDLLHPDGVENPGGIASISGFALIGDFETIQAVKGLKDVGATLENVSQIAVPHVFKPGKCMIKVYCTQKKGTVKSDAVGDWDGIGKKTTTSVFIPGIDAKVLGTVRLIECSNGIVFAQMSDGTIMQIGSERFPAKAKGSFDSSDNEGVRGTTITFETYERLIEYLPGLNFVPAAAAVVVPVAGI